MANIRLNVLGSPLADLESCASDAALGCAPSSADSASLPAGFRRRTDPITLENERQFEAFEKVMERVPSRSPEDQRYYFRLRALLREEHHLLERVGRVAEGLEPLGKDSADAILGETINEVPLLLEHFKERLGEDIRAELLSFFTEGRDRLRRIGELRNETA